jgi:hypothetical protein
LSRPPRHRRRFGAAAAALGLGLIAAAALIPSDGVLEAITLALLASGLGLAVAGVFILLDRNPLRRAHSDSR